MSGEAAPKPPKKNGTAKKKPTEPAPSVQALFMQSRRCVEAATIVRAVSQQIVSQFHSDNGLPPLLLLQRRGEGPRAATTEAIVDATITLEGVARHFESRARELLGLPELGGTGEDESSEGLIVDEFVTRESAEAEFKMVAKKLG